MLHTRIQRALRKTILLAQSIHHEGIVSEPKCLYLYLLGTALPDKESQKGRRPFIPPLPQLWSARFQGMRAHRCSPYEVDPRDSHDNYSCCDVAYRNLTMQRTAL